VAIVTGEDAPDLTDDGRRLRVALGDRGVSAEGTVWDDPGVDWERYDLALIRSCWKYYTDPGGFEEWLSRLERAGVTVRNPPDVVRWNRHKSYLPELAAAGVETVPTEVVPRGADRTLAAVLDDRGWDEAVVKPAVGTSSAGVWRTSRETARADQDRFEAPFPAARRVGDTASPDEGGTLSERDRIVQPFVPEVARGELSFVFFGGEYSHAWHSVRADDALGVDAEGGGPRGYDPDPATVESAASVLRTAGRVGGFDPVELAHARVDGVVRDGEFLLLELELIEPYLHLDARAGAVEDYAEALTSTLE
jgi:glutathione synthase/RimK-type ligase-like ATP-grasp enzyme